MASTPGSCSATRKIKRRRGAVVLGTLGGLAGGLACARRRRSPLARGLRGAAALALCIPVYSAALLVLFTISSNTGLAPLRFVSGSGQYVSLLDDPLEWLRSIWVPWLVLAAPIAAPCLRLTETMLRESAHEPFVRTARAKGLHERTVMRRHVQPARNLEDGRRRLVGALARVAAGE